MPAAHSEALWILISLVGLLVGAIVVAALRSARKKPQSEEISQGTQPAKALTREPPVVSKVETKPVAPVEDPFAASKTLKEALSQTEKSLFGRLKGLFTEGTADKNFDEIEEVLYTSDLGPKTVERLMEAVKSQLRRSEKNNIESIKEALRSEFQEIFTNAQIPEPQSSEPMQFLNLKDTPTVWMVVGVNGAGKTTSIGKMAAHLAKSGKKVLVAAGDTFRAAAGSQLKVWTDRAQVEIFSPEGVTDPSAVAFDAVTKAKAQGYDVVIVDTAGRLHTQSNLMEELKKMKRVMGKSVTCQPQEILIVLDANSGQNALLQAKEFHQALGLTGVILTKMDGTAKGGVAVGLANELQIPIRLIGVGEKIGDLRPFSAKEFVDSIL